MPTHTYALLASLRVRVAFAAVGILHVLFAAYDSRDGLAPERSRGLLARKVGSRERVGVVLGDP